MSLKLLCTALLCAASLSAHAELTLGQPVPAIQLVTQDGQQLDLSKPDGKVRIVNLWATWCTYCRREMPAITSYYQKQQQQGVQVIAINMDDIKSSKDQQAVEQFIQTYPFMKVMQKQVRQLDAFGEIWRLPMTFVIDQQGVLRRDGSTGEPMVDEQMLEQLVTPLLKPTPLASQP